MSIKEITSCSDRIKYLLENYSSLREDDKKLWISYLIMFHNLQDVLTNSNSFEELCKLLLNKEVTNAETIRRIRQKLQQSGLYEREEKVGKKKDKKTFNTKNRVEHLLLNYPALRDCDIQLWLGYLVMFHGMKDRLNESSDPYEEFCDIVLDKDVPAIETIRRSRQLFQQNGLYLGDRKKDIVLED